MNAAAAIAQSRCSPNSAPACAAVEIDPTSTNPPMLVMIPRTRCAIFFTRSTEIAFGEDRASGGVGARDRVAQPGAQARPAGDWTDGDAACSSASGPAQPPAPNAIAARKISGLRLDTSAELALGAVPIILIGAVGSAALEKQLVRATRDLFRRNNHRRRRRRRVDRRFRASAASRPRLSFDGSLHQMPSPSDPARLNDPSA